MRNKWTRRLFPLIALLLLAPWPVAYTYDNASAEGGSSVTIIAADLEDSSNIEVFGKATGGFEPGDLFYIDATNNPADITVTLYITNADRLSQSFSHMIARVGMYVESGDGTWESLSADNGGPLDDTFITMRDARVSITLPGYARYRMTIEGGSYYCVTAGGDELAPVFFLKVE